MKGFAYVEAEPQADILSETPENQWGKSWTDFSET